MMSSKIIILLFSFSLINTISFAMEAAQGSQRKELKIYRQSSFENLTSPEKWEQYHALERAFRDQALAMNQDEESSRHANKLLREKQNQVNILLERLHNRNWRIVALTALGTAAGVLMVKAAWDKSKTI